MAWFYLFFKIGLQICHSYNIILRLAHDCFHIVYLKHIKFQGCNIYINANIETKVGPVSDETVGIYEIKKSPIIAQIIRHVGQQLQALQASTVVLNYWQIPGDENEMDKNMFWRNKHSFKFKDFSNMQAKKIKDQYHIVTRYFFINNFIVTLIYSRWVEYGM